jgi:hypothetical protein
MGWEAGVPAVLKRARRVQCRLLEGAFTSPAPKAVLIGVVTPNRAVLVEEPMGSPTPARVARSSR